jgi:hypothetical protein
MQIAYLYIKVLLCVMQQLLHELLSVLDVVLEADDKRRVIPTLQTAQWVRIGKKVVCLFVTFCYSLL